jgi:hypothetical protein
MFLAVVSPGEPLILLTLTPAEAAFLEGNARYLARLVSGSQTSRDLLTLADRLAELRPAPEPQEPAGPATDARPPES